MLINKVFFFYFIEFLFNLNVRGIRRGLGKYFFNGFVCYLFVLLYLLFMNRVLKLIKRFVSFFIIFRVYFDIVNLLIKE